MELGLSDTHICNRECKRKHKYNDKLVSDYSKLLYEMEAEGWELTSTSNGNLQCKAPDGVTLIHIPNREPSGRGLTNVKVRFQRWKKQQDNRLSHLDDAIANQVVQREARAEILKSQRVSEIKPRKKTEPIEEKDEMDTGPVKYEPGKPDPVMANGNRPKPGPPRTEQRAKPIDPPTENDSLKAIADELVTQADVLLRLAARLEALGNQRDEAAEQHAEMIAFKAKLKDLLT